MLPTSFSVNPVNLTRKYLTAFLLMLLTFAKAIKYTVVLFVSTCLQIEREAPEKLGILTHNHHVYTYLTADSEGNCSWLSPRAY